MTLGVEAFVFLVGAFSSVAIGFVMMQIWKNLFVIYWVLLLHQAVDSWPNQFHCLENTPKKKVIN